MNSPEQRDPRPRVRWWRAVCVLGLLAGVLAMHGLAPGGDATGHSHDWSSTAVGVTAHETSKAVSATASGPSTASMAVGPTPHEPSTTAVAAALPPSTLVAAAHRSSTAAVAAEQRPSTTGVVAEHRPSTPLAAALYGECTDGHCGGGHAQHADPTCASGAVGGGPALPVLVPDPTPVPVRADAVPAWAAAGPDGARAPPDLAELQLLRI